MTTDLSRLLKDAAGAPPLPLDMNAVRRRAERSGTSRWRPWALAFVGLLGLGGPVANVLSPANERPTVLETSRHESRGPDAEVEGLDIGRDTDSRTVSSGRNATDAGGRGLAPRAGRRDVTAPRDSNPGPSGEGCEAPGDLELIVAGFGSPPACTYTATRPGGYRTTAPLWQIDIWRSGQLIQLGDAADPMCADVGIIQPGDRVTARATSRRTGQASAGGSVQVGTEARC